VVDRQTDILIVGGGLTGVTLAQALRKTGHRCLLLESNSFVDNLHLDLNSRSLALSPASINILKQLGFWSALAPKATPIHAIHVSQQQQFGRATIAGESALGYIVEMPHLLTILHNWLPPEIMLTQANFESFDADQSRVHCLYQGKPLTISAKLIVAADGMQSAVRQAVNFQQSFKEYGQSAIITNIQLQRDHLNQAFERFTHEGPLAVLPLSGRRCAVVWAMSPEKAEQMAGADEDTFLQCLQKAFGYRLGRIQAAGKRVVYPLKQVLTNNVGQWPVVLVGNAAQTLHPVAGQGFNLALRDVATLVQLIQQYGLCDAMLVAYRKNRGSDRQAVVRFTNGLIDLFGQKIPGLSLIRGMGLLAFDNSLLMKQHLSHYARGFAGFTPDLACGIPLPTGVIDE
jgi:2-octaprenyl-6-methoxyphenol hydroxylase